ncbi:MAG: hypothetical protein EHM34_06645, partial [Nitrosopumilales archaeon]
MKFVNCWEEDDRVYLKTKTELLIEQPEWYFTIEKKDASENRDILKDCLRRKAITRFEDEGTGWIRIYTPYLKRKTLILYLRSMMKTYEDDVRLWQRYLIDNEIELETEQSVLYFDIECEDLKRGLNAGNEKIVSIAVIGSDGREDVFYSIKSEKTILKKFIERMNEYDILAGWFSEGFDLVAIKKRCDLNKIPFDCRVTEWSAKDLGGLDSVRKQGRERARPEKFNHIDLMQKMKEMHYRDTELIKKVRSFSLGSVSKVILGEDKVDLNGESIYNLSRNNPELLKKYNLQDTRLLKKLDDKLQIIKQKLIEHAICGARINDYTSHGKIDPFALRAAKRFNKRLPSRPDQKKIEDSFRDNVSDVSAIDVGNKAIKKKGDYAGGFVFDPTTGIHPYIHVFDFSSLYPSIIKTFNVSPETYVGDKRDGDTIRMPDGATFS